ncbi:MAG: serine/threonine-protein kinase [Pseudomonadota bacterium]
MAKLTSNDELAALTLFESVLELSEEQRKDTIASAPNASAAVKARAKELLAAHEEGGGSFMTGGATAYSPDTIPKPDKVGAYRIVEEIGRGGMGLVFRAERDAGDFDHEVAIKMVLTGTLSDRYIERFNYERQTLASLNHPGIAKLFDGGETEDGWPYLIMELVEGRSLRSWFEEDRPSLGQRLTVLDQIMQALEFAHSRLVIHRDLTPENVIVDTDSGAKLIDFGISSLQSSPDKNPIETGQSGTPGFKAPEHAAGSSSNLAIDIYALGKIAEFLLSDQNDPELNAITAMASAYDPDDRYASVAAMADDLRRFRTGHAVQAFAGGGSYKAAKFFRRNWAPVAVAAGITAIVVTSITALVIAFGNEREARQLAQERFDAVRDLANFQLFDVYDDLVPIDGTIEVREAIVDKSIFYLDALGAGDGVPSDVRRDIGNGWLRMSEITGGASGNHIGDPEQAKLYAQRSLETLDELYKQQPNDPDTKFAYGRALTQLAFQSLYMHGDSDQGYKRADLAMKVLGDLQPKNADVASILVAAPRALGDAYGWQNDLEKAGEAYAVGIERFEALSEEMRGTPDVINAVSASMRQQAEVYRYTGRPDEAVEQIRAVLSLTQSLLTKAEGEARKAARRNQAIQTWNLADMLHDFERWEEAAEVAQTGLADLNEAIKANPNDIGWLELKPLLQSPLSRSLHRMGRSTSAITIADEAIAINRTIRKRSGNNVGSELALAVLLKEVTQLYLETGNMQTACSGLAEANAIFTQYEASGDLSQYDIENNAKPVRAMLEQCG